MVRVILLEKRPEQQCRLREGLHLVYNERIRTYHEIAEHAVLYHLSSIISMRFFKSILTFHDLWFNELSPR